MEVKFIAVNVVELKSWLFVPTDTPSLYPVNVNVTEEGLFNNAMLIELISNWPPGVFNVGSGLVSEFGAALRMRISVMFTEVAERLRVKSAALLKI